MKTTAHELGLSALDELTTADSALLFVAEDERPLRGLSGLVDWRLCGALSRVLRQGFFKGEKDERLLAPTFGKFPFPRVFVVGTGARAGLSAQELGELLAEAAKTLNRAGAQEVALELPGAAGLDERARASIFSNRFLPVFRGSRVAVLGDKELRSHLTLGAA